MRTFAQCAFHSGVSQGMVDAGAGASDELKATYLAARDAALGVGGDPALANRVGFWQAVEALRTLPALFAMTVVATDATVTRGAAVSARLANT